MIHPASVAVGYWPQQKSHRCNDNRDEVEGSDAVGVLGLRSTNSQCIDVTVGSASLCQAFASTRRTASTHGSHQGKKEMFWARSGSTNGNVGSTYKKG